MRVCDAGQARVSAGEPNDLAADPRIPRAVSVAPQPGKLPAAILRVIGQQLANGIARKVAAQPDSLHLGTRHDVPSLRANIVGAQAVGQVFAQRVRSPDASRLVKEAVQNAGAELQRIGGYPLVDAVEHAHEVQVGRQA